MVHACQKDGRCASDKIRDMADRVKNKDAEDFAKTKHNGLPDRVKEKKMKKSFKEYLAERDPDFNKDPINEYDDDTNINYKPKTKLTGQLALRTSRLGDQLGDATFLKQLEVFRRNIYQTQLPPTRMWKILRSAMTWYTRWYKENGGVDEAEPQETQPVQQGQQPQQ